MPELVGWLVGSLLLQSASFQSNVGAETFMWNSMTSASECFLRSVNIPYFSRCLPSQLFSFPILCADRRPVCDYARLSLASSLTRLVILGARPRKRWVKPALLAEWWTETAALNRVNCGAKSLEHFWCHQACKHIHATSQLHLYLWSRRYNVF